MANNEENFEEMYTSDSETSQSLKRKKKEAAKMAYQAGKKLGKKTPMVIRRAIIAALPYIGAIIAFILTMIVLITIIVYFFAGPDILRGQIVKMLDELFTSIADFCVGKMVGNEYAAVTDEAVTDVAKYIENMGYDLVSSGFIDDTEMKMYDAYLAGEDKNISSSIISDYLAAENRTYMLKGTSLKSLFKGISEIIKGNDYESTSFRSGMIDITDEIDAVTEIEIDGKTYKWDTPASDLDNGKGGGGDTLNRDIKIDRKTRKMTLTIIQRKKDGKKIETKTVYNLEGWVGRFGKPVEFLLALHLGTMAPKFSQAIATESAFDATVTIRLFKSVETCKVKFNGKDMDEMQTELNNRKNSIWNSMQANYNQQLANYRNAMSNPNVLVKPPAPTPPSMQDAINQAQQSLGITQEQINAAKKYETDSTKEKYTPYIVSVKNHWYKDLIFKNLEEASEDDAYVKTTIAPKESTWENGGTTFQVFTYSSGEIYQVAEPKESDINAEFDRLFTREKWTIMDGKTSTPINAIENFTHEPNKRILNPNELNMQIAVTMLEKAAQKSDDAKYIIRALKEYLELKGFKFKDSKILNPNGEEVSDDFNTNGSSNSNTSNNSSGSTTTGSITSINSLKGMLGGQSANYVESGKNLTIRTSEKPEGTKIYSIVGGKIVKSESNEVQIEVTSPSNLKGKTVIMRGINTDTAIKPGTVINKNTPIATTSKSDMTISLRDESYSLISVKDNLK